MQHRFPEPRQRTYWHNPELVRSAPMKEGFELIDTYADESHLRRYGPDRGRCADAQEHEPHGIAPILAVAEH
jgi:hypothetical protein